MISDCVLFFFRYAKENVIVEEERFVSDSDVGFDRFDGDRCAFGVAEYGLVARRDKGFAE